MQAQADWSQQTNASAFERDFGHKFTGPGFYLTAGDTILALPRRPHDEAIIENVWNVEQPGGTIWEVHVFNCNFRDTIFAASAVAPVRVDQR